MLCNMCLNSINSPFFTKFYNIVYKTILYTYSLLNKQTTHFALVEMDIIILTQQNKIKKCTQKHNVSKLLLHDNYTNKTCTYLLNNILNL